MTATTKSSESHTHSTETAQLIDPIDRKYVIICGLGKSGSKRILKIFDSHPETHCRCEPNELLYNPFAKLVSREFGDEPQCVTLDRGWDIAITKAASQIGERDYLPTSIKKYHTPLARNLPLYRLLKHTHLRRTLGFIIKQWREAQWITPSWYANKKQLDDALPVFKLGPSPAWIKWVAANRTNATIIHVIRHPAGFINSYRGRFLSGRNQNQITRDNIQRLKQITRRYQNWADTFGDIGKMNAVEAELWYWRYCCESIHADGCDKQQYHLIKDEDVVENPTRIANLLYQVTGLPTCPNIDKYIAKQTANWQQEARPWKQLVNSNDIKLIERVLTNSTLENFWPDDQLVSDYRYNAYGQTRQYTQPT